MRVRSLRRLGVAVAAAAATAATLPAAAAAVVPQQFIAKTYVEALGRAPAPADWTNSAAWFTTNGCTRASLKTFGSGVLNSAEFASFGYDSASRVLAGYRTALNRDPDLSGLTNSVWELDTRTTSWSGAVDKLYDSAEFTALVSQICAAGSPDYDFGVAPAVDAPTTGSGFTGDQAALQATLNAARAGTTVWLASRAVIRLSSTLTVPAGVTLATTGSPPSIHYAKMARIVRADAWPTFSAPAVVLQPGAKLKSVWVDGQMSDPVRRRESAWNVRALSGTGTEVSSSRLSNPAGSTNLAFAGAADTGTACVDGVVNGNTVDSWSSDHRDGRWVNGIAVGCEDASVTGNTVLDASDVGITLRGQGTSTTQASEVSGNTVVNAGDSAFAAIALDPGRNVGGAGDAARTSSRSFSGASVRSNTIFNSARAPLAVGIGVGGRAWYGTRAFNGSGASVTANGTGGAGLHAQNGIVVSGMLSATVSSNTLSPTLVSGESSCTSAAIGADVTGGHASGTIQTPYTDTAFEDCVGDRNLSITERSGSSHIFSEYAFGTECSLVEGARRLAAQGAQTIKIELWDPARYYKFGDCDWTRTPAATPAVDVAQTPEYRAVFELPFSSYVIMTYSSLGHEWWLDGSTARECGQERDEMEDLATEFLTRYRGTGKQFVIQNWEGDWAARGPSRDPNTLPTAAAISGMTAWLNCRQEGIEAARNNVPSDVKVLHGCEVNLVRRALVERLPGTLIDEVIPNTDCDLVSYSAWDTAGYGQTGDWATGRNELVNALDYIASRAPAPDAYTRAALGAGFRNVYVGEYGWPEMATSTTLSTNAIRIATEASLDWGARWSLFWQMYDNERRNPGPGHPRNEDMNGYWLFKPDGTRSAAGDFLIGDVWRRVSG